MVEIRASGMLFVVPLSTSSTTQHRRRSADLRFYDLFQANGAEAGMKASAIFH